ncbi:MAG: hypothetical protein HOB37_13465, partial [Rhodospirillaceae bacterium]|nr:hypothetical protein [Rhodospirillaceae bacterium]
PTLDRAIAMAAGFALFFVFGRHIFAGTIGAFSVFLALTMLRAEGMI